MPKQTNVDSVLDNESAAVEVETTDAVEETVEDAVSIEPEVVEEPKVEEAVEEITQPAEVKEEVEEAPKEEPKEALENARPDKEVVEPEAEDIGLVFQPASLIPVYTRPDKKYYDCRRGNTMKILDLHDYNGFVLVGAAVSGRGACKLFIRKEHLPKALQSKIVAK